MSLWKTLFGGGSETAATPAAHENYNGYLVEAAPYPADGQYQVAGVISKEINGARQEHKFIRADRFASRDEAATFSITKAKQIIDQNGDRIFK